MLLRPTPGFTRAIECPSLPAPVRNAAGTEVRESLRLRLADPIWKHVLIGLDSRSDFGYNKYSERLYSHDGRGPADAWQEVLDLIQYLERNRLEGEEAENAAICRVLEGVVKVYG